jgi:IS1 family transposase
MANRLSHETRKLILRLLCEGNSIRSTARITGVEKKTVSRIIFEFGNACRAFLDDKLRNLTLGHIEVDEIWSFVGKKQGQLTVEEKATRHDIGDVYLWTAVDSETKLIPTFALGKRSADMARRFMVDLASRITLPSAAPIDDLASNSRRYDAVTQISTDGFAGYPEAVDLAFGPFADHGVIIKEYKNAKMTYSPSEMVGTKRKSIRGLKGNERTICTSYVERNNGTIRTFMKRFTRLTYAFSKKLDNHAAACAMFVAYYNFVWRTRHSDQSGKAGKLRPTAAMMAKVTDRLWSFDDLYNEVINYG